MRRFYSPDIDAVSGRVSLDKDESHHLRDVLRLARGDEVAVFDGRGREYLCRVAEIGKRLADLDVLAEIEPPAPESSCEITLASALLKHDKFETVIQKSVELGVVRLIPLWTARCDVRMGHISKRIARWRRIALDAAKQCGRARLMAIDEPADLTKFLVGDHGPSSKIFFSERDGARLDPELAAEQMVLVTGPEGGWDDAEIRTAFDNGYSVVTLGGRILRAETAAIAITAIIQHRLGDIN